VLSKDQALNALPSCWSEGRVPNPWAGSKDGLRCFQDLGSHNLPSLRAQAQTNTTTVDLFFDEKALLDYEQLAGNNTLSK
jgi:hypothetical protein